MSRLLVARALDPSLRGDLASTERSEELPFVRGRTVVPDGLGDGDVVIAGHPNYLGVFDAPETPWIAVTGRWSSLRPIEGATAEIGLEAAVGPELARASLSAAVDLAKRIDQLKGATIAFPPESPILVVLLSVDPAVVANAMALPGCSPLTAFHELPGGLRISPDPVAPGETLGRYAAALEEASARWM